MTKRQLIDEILTINRSAQPEFLARFSEEDLNDYIEHLRVLRRPRLSGDPHRYDKYFSRRESANATEAAEWRAEGDEMSDVPALSEYPGELEPVGATVGSKEYSTGVLPFAGT